MSINGLTAEWETESENWWELTVRVGPDEKLESHVFYDGNELLCIGTTSFQVKDKYKGIGTRIMMGAFALAKTYGVTYSTAHIESPAALRIRQKIFGDDIVFTDTVSYAPAELPMTTNQAIQTLQRGQALLAKDRDTRELGLIVASHLTTLDTTGWEIPTELNKPLGLQQTVRAH